MKVRCTEIQWDLSDYEGKPPKLPKSVTLTVPDLRENEDKESLVDELGELLTEEKDFCVLSFNYRIIK